MKIYNRITNILSNKNTEEFFKAKKNNYKRFVNLTFASGILIVGTLAMSNTADAKDVYVAMKLNTATGEVDGPYSIKLKDNEINYIKLEKHGHGGKEPGHEKVRGYHNSVEIDFSISTDRSDIPCPNGTHVIFGGIHYCL